MQTTRRTFLQQFGAAGLVALGAVPPPFLVRAAQASGGASEHEGNVLVLVELAGGNDGLNTVIPYADEEYYKARPGIGIPREQALRIDGAVGFHPAMSGVKQLYDDGVLAVVQGVGYPNPDRSHFRSMDIWHSARPEAQSFQDGWLGRALDQTADRHLGRLPALAFGVDMLPLALLASKVNVPTVQSLNVYRWKIGSGSEASREAKRKTLETITGRPARPGSELDFLRQTARTAFETAAKLQAVTAAYRPAAEYPANGLAERLRTVAQMIAGDLGVRIFFVSLGGFDTHSQQQAAHQGLLAEFSSAVQAFYRDLHGHGLAERVLVSTFSEFGRRVAENGSLGTDHGAASQLFVIGAKCQGGVHGAHPSLTDLEQGDLKFHTDFRSVYATLLTEWLGFPSESVLGGKFPNLDFV